MIHWVNSHGIEVIIAYMVFAAVAGSMPPLPENANYWARWAYGATHALAMNLRQAMATLNVKVPEAGKTEDVPQD